MNALEVEAKLLGVADKIREAYPEEWAELLRRCEFRWKNWAGKRLGQFAVRRGKWSVEMHACLRALPAQRRDTFLHEVAHAIVEVGGSSRDLGHHGPIWRSVAAKLGCDTSARSFDRVAGKALREHRARRLKVVARCERCAVDIRRTRALKRNRRWTCGRCGTELVTYR